MLELVEVAFDQVAEGVDGTSDCVLRLAVPTHGNDRLRPSGDHILADGFAVVSLVGDQHLGSGQGPTSRPHILCNPLSLRWQSDGDGQANEIGPQGSWSSGRLENAEYSADGPLLRPMHAGERGPGRSRSSVRCFAPCR